VQPQHKIVPIVTTIEIPQPPKKFTKYTTTTKKNHKIYHNHLKISQNIPQPPEKFTNILKPSQKFTKYTKTT